jgi:hypothetical protein
MIEAKPPALGCHAIFVDKSMVALGLGFDTVIPVTRRFARVNTACLLIDGEGFACGATRAALIQSFKLGHYLKTAHLDIEQSQA